MRIKIQPLNQKGIGLVETMLALGIGVIIITSMVSLSIFTLRSSLQNKLALEGSQLANQEIEQIRAFRDSQIWDEFLAAVDGTNGIDCFNTDCHMLGQPVSGAAVSAQGTPEEISRSFRLSDQSGGDNAILRVAVTVSWRIGSDTKFAHSYTELSNWRIQ